jgi:hypothetical protein
LWPLNPQGLGQGRDGRQTGAKTNRENRKCLFLYCKWILRTRNPKEI